MCVHSDNPDGFVDDIGVLCGGIEAYTELFRSGTWGDRSELDQALARAGHRAQETAEELLQAEESWEEFLTKVESWVISSNHSSPVSPKLMIGDCLPPDLLFSLVRDDNPISLQDMLRGRTDESEDDSAGRVLQYTHFVLNRFFGAGVRVVVVTFGEASGAVLWQRDTACPFLYCRDRDRALYGALGLRRSVKAVWGVSTVSHYGSAVARGVKLPEAIPHSNLKDDPHQMGGDVTVDTTGRIVFLRRSATPFDRPSVDDILAAVRATS